MKNPKLRSVQEDGSAFPDWVLCRFRDVFSERNETGKADYELLSVTASEGVIKQDNSSKRDTSSEDKSKYKVVQIGDVAYNTMRMWQGTCGVSKFIGIVSPAYTVVVPRQGVSKFFAYYFKTASMKREFLKFSQGLTSDTLNLKYNNFSEIEAFLPRDDEQVKLVEFFTVLDEKIALAERKLTVLQTLKTGLMQKIFSREMRFKQQDGTNFGEWKKFNFFEVVDSLNDCRGRPISKYGREWLTEKTEYLALSALNVKEYGIDYSVEPHYGDKKLYEKWMAGRELHQGQVLLTTEAPAGVVMQIPDNKKYILNQRVVALNANLEVVTEDFLAFLMRSPEVQRDIRKLSSGGTAIGISQKSLRGLFVQLPISKEEQNRIAAVLSAVDDKICLATKKVDLLKQQKQAFLQQMFV